MQSGLRSALGTPVNSNDINIKTEPHERGSILVAAVFDAYFTVYTRRTVSLFRIFRAGGGTTDRGDLPVPLAERLAAEANRTTEQFFVICARALDCCPPVDITFGDFLRAVLTSDLDFHPDDPDGVRDALMQAFRLRGIVADEVASFSEDSLFWSKVKHDLLKVEGLVFGGRRMPTETCFASLPSRTQRILVLIRIGGRSMRLRSIRCSTPGRTVACSSIWSSSWCRRCKSPRRYQSRNVSDAQRRHAAYFPGSLVGDDRPPPRVRFVIQKLWTKEREERVRNYYLSTGRAPDSAGDAGAKDRSRSQINFGLLHAGVRKWRPQKGQHPGRNGRSPRKSNGASSHPPRPRAKRLRQARLPRQQGLPGWEQRCCAYACIALASVTSFC